MNNERLDNQNLNKFDYLRKWYHHNKFFNYHEQRAACQMVEQIDIQNDHN